MFAWYRRRWLDLVVSIYIYNEHRGYTALDRVLRAVRSRSPGDHAFIAEIEQHRADEHKHYLMFKRWWERRGQMPFAVDRTCGHIDRFVEIMFRSRIDDLDEDALIRQDRRFEKLCRVIALTERRGYRQIEILLRHPVIRRDRALVKIFRIIKADEPRHWAPYEAWLKAHGGREPRWWERAIDQFIHSELLLLKLPILFFTPRLKRQSEFADASDQPGPEAATYCGSCLEDRQVQRLAWPKPDHVLGVIGEIVAGRRVREDGEWAAIERHPLREVPKVFGRDSQLAAAPRMRSDRPRVEMSDSDIEALTDGCSKRLGLFDLACVEINMGMEIGDGIGVVHAWHVATEG